ncbi:MAG: DUF2075 domain-containing protein [Chloroflexi bacterium]|nr:DUF2075 domain-containing protein [Chloroflexota bacterium]MDA1240826.1 DUF2075 domain-containing protein [Chloroflexota bacterium]MQC19299.1 DUF2075 domain-containing protein [Chloroflexota bacterium]
MPAWHHGTLADLLSSNADAIVATLAAAAADRRRDPNPQSMVAWRGTIEVLTRAARELALIAPEALRWPCFLEFEVPRRSRRVDAVILADDVIFPIEWKVGAGNFDRAALWQAEQYALDMRDFHEGSRGRRICPVLIATEALPRANTEARRPDSFVQAVEAATPDELAATLLRQWRANRAVPPDTIDATWWEHSGYRPTPNIVEAASLLYGNHDVKEISVSGAQNLDATVDAVLDLIDTCRAQNRRGIAFITGSPGSGKTLAGLQVVHTPALLRGGEAAGVFLSGNMPLVEVIRAALSESARRGGQRKQDADREVSTFIQHAYAFRNQYAENDTDTPPEHVVLFDEAQRAWDRQQVSRWTRGASTRSEPEILLDVMNRVPDWAVVVAMVGSGQEINSGEAGLGEWGRALRESHPDWLVRASPSVLPDHTAPPGGRLFDDRPSAPIVTPDGRLNLQMNVRSPRAERLNQWVDALLRHDLDTARSAFPDPAEFPMVLTRSLDDARRWLRDRADVDHRAGLIASADARRLRAWGIDTRTLRQEKSWADWFLKPRGDVRGSDQLEIAATNFDCQGLEIDWAGVCWGNDFVPSVGLPSEWRARRFTGTSWSRVNDERAQFILNGYRVNLTRARRGQIIWVPQPDGSDATLDPVDFDRIADLLQEAGVPLLD